MTGASAAPASLRGQVMATGIGELATRVAQILSVSLVGWVLGAEALGIAGMAWSLAAIAVAIVQAGPELAGTGELPRRSAHATLVAEVLAIKMAGALLAVPVLLLAAWALDFDRKGAFLQLGMQVLALLATSAGHAWVFRGLGQARRQAVLRMVQAALLLVFLAAGLVFWRSPLLLPLAEAASAAVCVGLARRFLAADGMDRPRLSRPARSLVKASLSLGVASSLSQATWMMPIVAVAHAASLQDVSHLTASLRLVIGLNGVMQVLFLALFPHYGRIVAADPGRGGVVALAMTIQSALACLVLVALAIPLAGPILHLVFGPELGPAAPLFAALLPLLVPVALASPVTYGFIAAGRSDLATWIQGGATAVLVVGVWGAAWLGTGAWAALALHPVLWLQAGISLLLAHRFRTAVWPPGNWRLLFDPRRLRRMAHVPRGDEA
jgi:O-antigen/teichoic acid export membrane protein